MSSTDRQNRLLVNEDWQRIYQSFRNADFQSYDFDNLRRTMINYLRQNYPEDFNDYVESSEYLALVDMIAFLGQNLSFRIDLNARENFLETAERRESILRLARLLSYQVKRNQAANGLLKVDSVKTTEVLFSSSGTNLSNTTVKWNDSSNTQWLEQFTKIVNAALPAANQIGTPNKVANIDGVLNEQYRFSALNTNVPVFKFTKNIQGVTTTFEVTSTDIQGDKIIEEPPLPGNNPAFLFRDDGQGLGSSNSGFFMHFRQGVLSNGDFAVSSPVPNQIVAIDAENINNSDVWLYSIDKNGFENALWTKLEAVEGTNIIYNSLFNNIKNVYAVSSRVGDRINLVFSDGTFGNLPTGNFRVYYRVSDNKNILVSPSAMNNVTIEFPYVSKKNTTETMTINMSLKTPVSNAAISESNNRIKTVAPSTYYTQNRMVTGEDYNVGLLGINQNIIKVRSVNRASSGISRYFDLKDVTGKYSTTNLYANDGILYKEEFTKKTTFNFTTQSDIEGIIFNTIEPILSSVDIRNFYLSKFSKKIVSDLAASWSNTSGQTNGYTGKLNDQDGVSYTVGSFTSNSLRLIEKDTLLKFVAPEGKHFMSDGTLMDGSADHLNSTTYKWTKVINVRGNGTLDLEGVGPILLNDFIDDGAILQEIRPRLASVLIDDVKTQIIDQTFAFNNFALRYDDNVRQWKLITSNNINTTDDFNLGKAGNLSGQNLDASWLLYFKTNGENYTMTYRNLRYVMESESEIRFYFDNADKIYDPKKGKTFRDKIDILNVNREPDALTSFTQDWSWNIVDGFRDSQGYVDSKKIQISFFDSDDDGVVDDPDIFDNIVNENVNPENKLIFQKKYISADGVENYEYFANENNTILIRENENSLGSRSQYDNGQIFYFLENNTFKVLDLTENVLSTTADYVAFVGRSDLKIHYVHVADTNQRIDPAASNIMDTYILTQNYDTNYRLWLQDDLSSKPLPPSSDALFREYGQSVQRIKSISDEVIYHPVKYKSLFGSKSLEDLQVTFKVVKNPNLVLNDNEVKSEIITYINRFFSIENWDFGDTFYFQELSTYIMSSMSPKLVSIVIVPKQNNQTFGSLFEIKSEPDEIFISSAKVSDVEIIDEITETKLKASGKVINSVSTTNTGIQSSASTSTSTGGSSY